MKFLTSPSRMGQVGVEPFNLIKERGYKVLNNSFGRKLSEDEVFEFASDCVGIAVRDVVTKSFGDSKINGGIPTKEIALLGDLNKKYIK